jgi:hypothetical protein
MYCHGALTFQGKLKRSPRCDQSSRGDDLHVASGVALLGRATTQTSESLEPDLQPTSLA